MTRRRILKELRKERRKLHTPADRAVVFILEATTFPQFVALVAPDPNPAFRRFAISLEGAVLADGPRVIDAGDIAAELVLTARVGMSLGHCEARVLPADHPLSVVAPSLDHLADLIVERNLLEA